MSVSLSFQGTRYMVADLLNSEPGRIYPWDAGEVPGFPRNEDVTDADKAEAISLLTAAGVDPIPRPYRVYLARFLAWHERGIHQRGDRIEAFACGCVAWVKSDHPPSPNTLSSFQTAVTKVYPEVEAARPVMALCRSWLTRQSQGDAPDSEPKVAIGPDDRRLAIWLMHAGDGADFLSIRRRMVARLACVEGMGYGRMVNLTWGDLNRVNAIRPVYELRIGLTTHLFHAGTPAAYDVHRYYQTIEAAHKAVWGVQPADAFPLLIRVKGGEPVVSLNGRMPTPLHGTTIRGILKRLEGRGA